MGVQVLEFSASPGLGPGDHVLEDPLCDLSIITSLDESTERVQVLGWQWWPPVSPCYDTRSHRGHIGHTDTLTRDSQGQALLDTEHGTVTSAQRRENKTQVKWVFALVNLQYFSLNCVVVLVLDQDVDIFEKHYYLLIWYLYLSVLFCTSGIQRCLITTSDCICKFMFD